jgi:hypothetical protein
MGDGLGQAREEVDQAHKEMLSRGRRRPSRVGHDGDRDRVPVLSRHETIDLAQVAVGNVLGDHRRSSVMLWDSVVSWTRCAPWSGLRRCQYSFWYS